jgi:hypothetical protein
MSEVKARTRWWRGPGYSRAVSKHVLVGDVNTRSEIGASASDKETEEDFLHGIAARLRRIVKSPRPYLDFWNYLEEVDVRIFRKEVTELLAYVEEVLSTPYTERGERAFK